MTSKLHLQTAIHQAVIAESQTSLRTKTVHSEILFAMNPTNNVNRNLFTIPSKALSRSLLQISEAIRRYGVSDTSNTLLVVHIAPESRSPADEIEARMRKAVEGTLEPFTSLEKTIDWQRVRKVRNVTDPDLIMLIGPLVS